MLGIAEGIEARVGLDLDRPHLGELAVDVRELAARAGAAHLELGRRAYL